MSKFWITKAGDYFETSDDLAEVAGATSVEQRPNPDCDMVGGKWVQRAPDLIAIRASTAIDRAVFCNRLADHGVLTDAEAISAAKSDWPEAMLFFLGFLTAAQQRDAQITWASCVTVERNHWLVLAMISLGVVTESVADAVFGIGA